MCNVTIVSDERFQMKNCITLEVIRKTGEYLLFTVPYNEVDNYFFYGIVGYISVNTNKSLIGSKWVEM
jgi:hypothetical protein